MLIPAEYLQNRYVLLESNVYWTGPKGDILVDDVHRSELGDQTRIACVVVKECKDAVAFDEFLARCRTYFVAVYHERAILLPPQPDIAIKALALDLHNRPGSWIKREGRTKIAFWYALFHDLVEASKLPKHPMYDYSYYPGTEAKCERDLSNACEVCNQMSWDSGDSKNYGDGFSFGPTYSESEPTAWHIGHDIWLAHKHCALPYWKPISQLKALYGMQLQRLPQEVPRDHKRFLLVSPRTEWDHLALAAFLPEAPEAYRATIRKERNARAKVAMAKRVKEVHERSRSIRLKEKTKTP